MRRKWAVLVIGLSVLGIGVVVLAHQQPAWVWPEIATLPDIHFFSDPKCMVACWQGLRPGETTRNETADYLRKVATADLKTSPYGYYTLYIVFYQHPVSIAAVVSPTHLVSLELSGYSNLDLDKVVKALGNPPYVRMSYGPNPDGSLALTVDLYYPQEGFMFSLQNGSGFSIERTTGDKVRICLRQEAVVSQAKVVAPGTIEAMASTTELPFATPSRADLSSLMAHLTSWPGFTCISQPWPEP